MPKGYWLPQIDVSNPEGYKAYMAATPPAHEKYRGVALVRGGKSEVVEGRVRSRGVIREFPDYATALACYRSDEYQRARPLRLPHSTCDFVIVEGYDGAQPPRRVRRPPAAAKQRLLDRPCRCHRSGRLQGLHGRRHGAVRQIRRPLPGARRRARSDGRQSPQPQRGDRISELRRRRSPATARPIIRRPRSCATAEPRPISSSSKATTGRSSSSRAQARPASSPFQGEDKNCAIPP